MLVRARVKIPVTRNALFQRIRRRIRKRGPGNDLRKARESQRGLLGDYYIVSPKGLRSKDVDLVKLAEEIGGLILPWEVPER